MQRIVVVGSSSTTTTNTSSLLQVAKTTTTTTSSSSSSSSSRIIPNDRISSTFTTTGTTKQRSTYCCMKRRFQNDGSIFTIMAAQQQQQSQQNQYSYYGSCPIKFGHPSISVCESFSATSRSMNIATSRMFTSCSSISSSSSRRSNNSSSTNCSREYSNGKNSSSTTSSSSSSSGLLLSPRQRALYEDYIYTNVAMLVHDPILHRTVHELGWFHKRIAISMPTKTTTTNEVVVDILLNLPTALHPKIETLKELIQTQVKHYTTLWLEQNYSTTRTQQQQQQQQLTPTVTITVNVQTLVKNQPISVMAQLLYDYTTAATSSSNKYTNNNSSSSSSSSSVSAATTTKVMVDETNNTQQQQPAEEDEGNNEVETFFKNLGPGLRNVAHIVAVYSCKGGVGKSTIAVNLAYELCHRGGRIGILDLDLYGPSLPTLIQPNDTTICRSNISSTTSTTSSSTELLAGMVDPIVHHNVKVLSLGYVNQNSGVPGSGSNNGASIMKGPMAVKVVTQLLKLTNWDCLDVLILDLPPGTGDIQLATLQEIQLSGVVAVTTPSKLAFIDTMKGIEMFTSLGVPTLAIVENMSYFKDDTGKIHYPFGKGLTSSSSTTTIDNNDNDKHDDNNNHNNNNKVNQSPLLYSYNNRTIDIVPMPISVITNTRNDNGIPLTLVRPDNGAETELHAYRTLADTVSKELLVLQCSNDYDNNNNKDQEVVVFGHVDTSKHDSSMVDNEQQQQQQPIVKKEEFLVSTASLSIDKTNNNNNNNNNKKFIVRFFSKTGAIQKTLSSSQLRSRDPKTGDIIVDSPFLHVDDENDSNDNDSIQLQKVTSSSSPIVVTTTGSTSSTSTSSTSTSSSSNQQPKKKKVLTLSPSIVPISVSRRGRYGFAVVWQDGATIIYSNRCIAKYAGGTIVRGGGTSGSGGGGV